MIYLNKTELGVSFLFNLEGMQASSKRLATSPAEKTPSVFKTKRNEKNEKVPSVDDLPAMPPKKANDEDAGGSLFKFEVLGINDKPFYGSLAECELMVIWEKVLGRSREEIFAMSYSRSLTRNFKVTFKLNKEIVPRDVYPEPNFVYYCKSNPDAAEEEDDAIHCRIVGYANVKPVELGQLTRITVKTNDFAVSPAEIIPWLSKFGSVSSNYDYERNSLGIRSDVFETEIVLNKHVPEFLPIAGRKVQVSYPGIPKACNNCFQPGHMKRNCKSKKVDWLDRVAELRRGAEFDDAMFGGWIAILERN